MQRVASSIAPIVLGSGINSLGEPLIPKNGNGEEEKQEEDETPIPLSSVSVIIGAVLLGGAGIAASAAAMVSMTGMIAVYVAGGLCIVNSLVVVTNQYQISKAKGYRQGVNDLRKEANRLSYEVDTLTNAVDDLKEEAILMKTFEHQLADITIRQGISVEKVVQLTKENEQILSQQKANLKQMFLSDMAKAFITSEFLTDMKVDLKNLPLLIMRLEIQLNSHGMELNAEKFSELVSKNNDVGVVIKQCGKLFNSSNADSSGLVTLMPEYSKGSLDAARGERLSLTSKSKHRTRNAIVRGVKNSLSTRGIVIDSESDINSEYINDEEANRLFGSSTRGTEPKSWSKLPHADGREVEIKAVTNFQVAPKKSRREPSPERSDLRQQEGAKPPKASPEKADASKNLKAATLNKMMFCTRGRRASNDGDTVSRVSKASYSFSRNDTGRKKKLTRRSTIHTYQKPTFIETSSRSSRRDKPAKQGGSVPQSRRIHHDEFNTLGSSDEAKTKPNGLRRSRSITDIALFSQGRSVDSQGSKRRTSSAKQRASSFRWSKNNEGPELKRDSSSRRRRVC